MKKLLYSIVCIIMILMVTSCSLFQNDNNSETIATTSKRNVVITKDEVKKQVDSGKIKGASLALGTKFLSAREYFLNIIQPGTTSKDYYNENHNGQNDEHYEARKGNNLTSMIYNGEQYFFLNNNINAGAAVIALFDKPLGFNVGNCPSVDVINSLGKPDVSDVPDSSQLFFAFDPYQNNFTRLTYNFSNKRLDFVFVDDNLSAVTLTDTSVYTGFKTGAPISSNNSDTTQTASSAQ